MTGSTRLVLPQGLACSICAKSVPLEDCRTDERGQAVHEKCYVGKVTSEFADVGLTRHAGYLIAGSHLIPIGSF